jgi:hypothetical protein
MPRGRSGPKRKSQSVTNRSATIASTMGYSGEILALQKRQRPRRMSQPRIGKFSRQVSLVEQDGHAEDGKTTLSPRGMR